MRADKRFSTNLYNFCNFQKYVLHPQYRHLRFLLGGRLPVAANFWVGRPAAFDVKL